MLDAEDVCDEKVGNYGEWGFASSLVADDEDLPLEGTLRRSKMLSL
jgi:hypothetical protein